MRARSVFITAIFPLVLGGCLVAADGMIEFRATGEVFDERTGTPLEGVKVVLNDTSANSDGYLPFEMGESDASGQIDVSLEYWFGGLMTPVEFFLGIGRGASPDSVDIELSKDGYESKVLRFTGLNPSNGVCDIDLGTVDLAPVSEKSCLLEVSRKAVAPLLLLQFALP
ncbi:MAG TPA: hypothetical protein HPP77_10175 [Candidatus Hydrogenedentes bacterium]|nr:hypothetical protein [Candidatus Hydrogenedentota bacterium]HIJ74773.1 hypothetical protein [Candidatus Hydrogenedentota bacterium]